MPQFSETVQDLIHFLRTPRLPEEEARPQHSLQEFVHLLVLSFGLSLLAMMLMSALQKGGVLPELPHAMEKIMKELPFLVVILLVGAFMPVLEELAFRLWLVYRPLYFGVSLWLVAFFLSQAFLQAGATLAGYSMLGLAALATILLLTLRDIAYRGLQGLYQRHYAWVFYGATLLFALVHLINFKADLHILVYAPVLVLPQFLLGLVLGYVRVRLGIGWAMALHGLYNTIILLMAYWGMQAQDGIAS